MGKWFPLSTLKWGPVNMVLVWVREGWPLWSLELNDSGLILFQINQENRRVLLRTFGAGKRIKARWTPQFRRGRRICLSEAWQDGKGTNPLIKNMTERLSHMTAPPSFQTPSRSSPGSPWAMLKFSHKKWSRNSPRIEQNSLTTHPSRIQISRYLIQGWLRVCWIGWKWSKGPNPTLSLHTWWGSSGSLIFHKRNDGAITQTVKTDTLQLKFRVKSVSHTNKQMHLYLSVGITELYESRPFTRYLKCLNVIRYRSWTQKISKSLKK